MLPKKPGKFIQYSGMAFQMLAIIIIGFLIGQYLDKKLSNETPIYTAIFALIFVVIALYSTLKDFINK